MAGLLDGFTSYLPQGLLNGDPDALAKALMAGDTEGLTQQPVDDPYAAFDKKQKDIAAKKAALSPFDGGPIAPAPVAPGISGQQVMNIGPFGSLSPMIPQQPQAATPLDAKAESVPLPVPRPVMPAASPAAPSAPLNITPQVANANASDNAPPVPDSSLLGRIGQALQTADSKIAPHTATLLALAGGLAGAPSWGSGIGRGMTAAAAALPMDQRLAMQNMGISQTFRALRESGVPPQLALASVYNPEILKSTVQSYIADRKGEVKTVKDSLGNEKLVLVNPYNIDQPVKDLTPKGAGGTSLLAKGVSEENPDLVGDAYMAQYSPDLQAMAKAYINGDIMPTGNPRMQGMQTKAKQIAMKWGQDTGVPVSDETYAAKRKIKTDLVSSGNSSLGGILSNGESSFSHLADAGESMADLGNSSHNFPLGGPIAHAQNFVGNALIPSSQTQGKVKALNDNLGRYGQESTKFYAGTGGGEAERTQARRDVNGESTSSEEMAAYLEKEKSLMLDRLRVKLDDIRRGLGEQEGNAEIQKRLPDIQRNISRIDASIARLRGVQAEPPSPTIGLPAGWSVQVR